MVHFFDSCVRKQFEEARVVSVFKHVPAVPQRENEGIKLGRFCDRQKDRDGSHE